MPWDAIITYDTVLFAPANPERPQPMPKPRRRWKLAVAIVLALGLVGGGVYVAKRRSAKTEETKTYKVARKSIAHTLQIAGKVIPVSSIVITPRQSGRIVDLAVQEGAQVNAGDLLFTMRLEAEGQTELLQKRAEVRSLELQVASATQRLAEKKPVRELIGSATLAKEESDLEKLKLDLTAARDRLEVLEADLGLSGKKKQDKDDSAKRKGNGARAPSPAPDGLVYVTSPRKGIVTLIDKRPGDFVLGGAGGDASASERTVMVVADMSSLQVRTRVLEADLRYVKPDVPVRVRLDAYPDVQYDGRVTHIGGQGRTDSKAGYTYFDVDVSIEQQDARVLPEMNASIELIFAQRDNVLALPVAAVAIFPDKALVHVPNPENEAGYDEKPVTVGVVSETDAEILTGLAEGDEALEIDFATLKLDGDDGDDAGDGKGSARKNGRARPKRT